MQFAHLFILFIFSSLHSQSNADVPFIQRLMKRRETIDGDEILDEMYHWLYGKMAPHETNWPSYDFLVAFTR